MKIKFLLVIELLMTINLLGQNKLIPVPVYNEVFTLHAALHDGVGEGAKKLIPIQLPPNTIKWYYSFSSSKTESDANSERDMQSLFTDISKLCNSSIFSLASAGLNKTASSIDLDVYLLNSDHDAELFSKNQHSYCNEQCSRMGFVNARNICVDNGAFVSGTQHLGFYNKNWRDADYVNLQVVAIVSVPVTKNGWTVEQRNELYNGIKKSLDSKNTEGKVTDKEIQDFTSCFVGKLVEKYSFEQFNALAEFEKKDAMTELMNECKALMKK